MTDNFPDDPRLRSTPQPEVKLPAVAPEALGHSPNPQPVAPRITPPVNWLTGFIPIVIWLALTLLLLPWLQSVNFALGAAVSLFFVGAGRAIIMPGTMNLGTQLLSIVVILPVVGGSLFLSYTLAILAGGTTPMGDLGRYMAIGWALGIPASLLMRFWRLKLQDYRHKQGLPAA